MTPERPLLTTTPFDAARAIALHYVGQAREAAPRLADPTDEEALHDFRVAVRRLRTTLRAWREFFADAVPREHSRAWDELQRSTGAGRDAQVAMSWIADERETADAEHRRGFDLVNAGLDVRFQDSMTAVRTSGTGAFDALDSKLRELLGSDVPPSDQTFADALITSVCGHAQRLSRILRRVRKRSHRNRMHKLRIACKRLRYLLEPLADSVVSTVPVIQHCRSLQGVLGDLNDTYVLEGELNEVLLGVETQTGEDGAAADEAAVDEAAVDGAAAHGAGVEELLRRVRDRQKKLFKRLRREWLKTGGSALLEAVGAFVQDLSKEARDVFEIEHKYLLETLPERLADAELPKRVFEIHQGWLPGERFRERLRRKESADGVTYTRTLKFGAGVRRVEVEEEVSKKFFDKTWPLTEGSRVLKRRHVVSEGAHEWELDEFLDRELFLAEVELRDENEAVDPPGWLAPHVVRQVTGESEYVNLNLAR